ncbi:jasmonate O-methyltransferase-like [Papaver somniferum]|uniref:jasmonate O-methyltransferase-like n=1 Tax=Papaver somniferum TaxID=3469 RepID=UPI000E70437F|nr:jasmonate O-methyltransferase-like [Papaver somniferum]
MDQATQHLYMNKGISEFSYSSNSPVSKQAIYKTKIVVEEAILDILSKFSSSTSISAAEKIRSICVADLGCSSGPTALLVISNLLDTIYNKYRESTMVMTEILVFLNDLPENDFNTLFKYLKSFCEELRNTKGDGFGPCFVAGMPGTFYGRLFPSNTVHFVHSSYSLHWLSQVSSSDPTNKESCALFGLLSMALRDMVSKVYQCM